MRFLPYHKISPPRLLKRTGIMFAALSLSVWGCTGGEDYQTVTSEDADHAEEHADDHHHEHTAPHGGHLIELGDHQYNAEVVLESDPKQLVVYLLDAHAENAAAIPRTPLQFDVEDGEPITLEPDPQEGDTEGQSSRFVASGPAIDAIADIEDLHGNLKVTIEGTEYAGELSHDHGEHAHGEDHDHAHEDH